MSAAPGINRNLAEALRTLLGGRVGGYRGFAHPRDQQVHRSHHKKVNCGGYQKESDCGIDEMLRRGMFEFVAA